jgi:hypothetical protein
MSDIFKAEQRPAFLAKYNRSSFMFDHELHRLDIFDLPNLVEVSKRLPDPAYYSTADVSVADGWKNTGDRRRSLPATIASIAETNSLVVLKHVEKDPEFGPVFRQVVAEVVDQVGEALRSDVEIGRATLLIASPRRVTPYHIDAEVNYLLQLRGDKLVSVFDAYDRTLLTDAEIEAFHCGDLNSAKYDTGRQKDAHVYDFKPGHGIHVPLHAPHWVQNGDDVSIAISINFSLKSTARASKVYKMNHRLRKTGLRPVAPGVSPWQDQVKIFAFDALASAKQAARSRPLRVAPAS